MKILTGKDEDGEWAQIVGEDGMAIASIDFRLEEDGSIVVGRAFDTSVIQWEFGDYMDGWETAVAYVQEDENVH